MSARYQTGIGAMIESAVELKDSTHRVAPNIPGATLNWPGAAHFQSLASLLTSSGEPGETHNGPALISLNLPGISRR